MSMGREISPPPSKRRRTTRTPLEPQHGQSKHSIRLFSWNVNGISPFIQKSITSFFTSNTASQTQPQASLRNFLRRQNFPTLVFLQEVKINPSDTATRNAVSRVIKRDASEPDTNPDYVVHFCLPHDTHNATGFGRKVYGVCSIVRKDFADQYVEHMRTVDWDAEGRFSVIETKACLDMPKLAVFNVYMVNGTDNPYKDSTTGIVTGTRHTRKLAVHQLLQNEIRRLELDGYQAVIAGDINIAVARIDGHPNLRIFPRQHVLNREDFIRRFLDKAEDSELESKHSEAGDGRFNDALDMADTFRLLHPNEKGYSYYPRGKTFGESCDRVDMILCSRSLAASCTEAGILATAVDRGPSDHVPIYSTFTFPQQAGLDRFESPHKPNRRSSTFALEGNKT
jgi:exonuclease III